MTRILSYNILVGGTRRITPLAGMIQAARPDIVGLVEATNPRVVEELAQRLEMQYVMSGHGTHALDWQIALLSLLTYYILRGACSPWYSYKTSFRSGHRGAGREANHCLCDSPCRCI